MDYLRQNKIPEETGCVCSRRQLPMDDSMVEVIGRQELEIMHKGKMNKPNRTQTWTPTKIPNLFRLKESGIYYGRVKPKGGKQIRKSLKTNSFRRRQEKLQKLAALPPNRQASGRRDLGDIIEPYQIWLQGQKIKSEITDSTIEYKEELIDNIRNTWDKFDAFKLAELTEKVLSDWQVKHRAKYCATRTNGAATVLREMIAVAVGQDTMAKETSTAALSGLRYVKVKYDYKRLLNNLPATPSSGPIAQRGLPPLAGIWRACWAVGSSISCCSAAAASNPLEMFVGRM